MPILNLQRQMRELGRIRTGVSVPGDRGRRPKQLATFRLTSSSQALIFEAAQVYGGTPAAWPEGDGWEVVTEAARLDIVIPPGQLVSQWWELWSGGGCLRRCDGFTNVLTMAPCECPTDVPERIRLASLPKPEACKATTRVNVILPMIPDLGVWRLESHGYYAAVELAGAADVLAVAAGQGRLVPARLVLEKREKKVPGKPTTRYTVPVIEILERMADVPGLSAAAGLPELAGTVRVPALPSTTLPETSDLRAPAPPRSLTTEELLEALDDFGIPRQYAIDRAKAMFGPDTRLDDLQRAQLLYDLQATLEDQAR